MMMMSGRAGGGGGAGRYPFTATQWQELEHQALIYKCLAAGKPIPSYLMPPLRRILDSALATSPSLAFPPQPSLGWGCFGMGFSRKADEDPEPGRCRRTDGKKWRCSKEAYPDSKYCEKHMHRGKNRSRKPVEMSLATPAPSSSNAASATSVTTATTSPAPSYNRPAAAAHDAAPYHALYGGSPYTASARPAGAYHAQVSPFHLHLDTTHPHPPPSYYSVDQRDYAYGPTAKEVGEHAFFSDGTTERDRHAAGQWQFKQLGMEPKQGPTSLFPGGGYGNDAASAYAVDLTKEVNEEEERRRQQQQHCFVLGADLRLERPSGHDAAAAAQKPLRPFFDEWPHEKSSKGSWMGLDGETQLSMSIPMSTNDIPITSRYRNDE
ncbi:growth-regulating factor 1-like [Phragmites australis]|uniref:growth-regulating factor 1-like n=1 Tax=Phragmites australis TaxID=29695 RepID=UPI002D774F15|nr:growth-regulating factor 1-like [Phragmites australis]